MSFATTAGSVDLFFVDGSFLQGGGMNSIGNPGSLFITSLDPVPAPGAGWLVACGLAMLGWRARSASRRHRPAWPPGSVEDATPSK